MVHVNLGVGGVGLVYMAHASSLAAELREGASFLVEQLGSLRSGRSSCLNNRRVVVIPVKTG